MSAAEAEGNMSAFKLHRPRIKAGAMWVQLLIKHPGGHWLPAGEISFLLWVHACKTWQASDLMPRQFVTPAPQRQPTKPQQHHISSVRGGEGRGSGALRSGIGPDEWMTSVLLCQVHWGREIMYLCADHACVFSVGTSLEANRLQWDDRITSGAKQWIKKLKSLIKMNNNKRRTGHTMINVTSQRHCDLNVRLSFLVKAFY